jgi:P27 family predicted phage terminase small subunit
MNRPKPTQVARREGNPGHRPLPAPVNLGVVMDEDLAVPPDDLPDTAKEWWLSAIPVLKRIGILETVDRAALEMAAVQYARWKQASRVVNQMGHIARGSTGQLTEHPSMATERAASALFLRFAEQYALTPTARTKLGLAEIERARALEDLAGILGDTHVGTVDGGAG